MSADGGEEPLVELDGLNKWFDTSIGITDRILGRDPTPVRAVDGIDLDIMEGDVMGIAGESGCGKTTLGKLLVKLHEPTSGAIRFDGNDISELSEAEEREFRKRVQMIFQDPFESLNPRMTVLQSVIEPLGINEMLDTYSQRRERVIEVLNDVGLAPAEAYLDKFPKELSGGELQRVAIARALVVDPEFVVCDEPVSMLDVSIRAGVLNLMKDLQDEYGLTYVFISHDLSLIRYMCDRTAIMYLGNVIEAGPTEEVIENSQHPYTEALFDAVPDIEIGEERRRANVSGEVPSPRDPPSGCRFHPRCSYIIPPDDWTGSQDAFRRAFQFRRRVTAGDITPESIGLERENTDETTLTDELMSSGLRLEVPEQHRAEGETITGIDPGAIDLPVDVRRMIREACEAIAAGNEEEARDIVEGEFVSLCEREPTELIDVGGQSAACHLYDEEKPPETAADPPAAASDD
ncbi:MAG: ABC transporter ATP-binding protein [Halolamina sp.]